MRRKLITRTITTTTAKCVVIDTTTLETSVVSIIIPHGEDTTKYAYKTLTDATHVFVKVDSVSEEKHKYGISVSDFIAHAIIIDNDSEVDEI